MDIATGFEGFVREQQLPLLRLAFVYSGDHHLAEDVVQDVLTRLYTLQDDNSIRDPAAYARRMVLNELRSRARRRSASERPMADVPDRPVTGLEQAGHRDALTLLRCLPHRQKAVLFLRYVADMSDADIAANLECSRLAVRMLAKRGLDRLRAQASDSIKELA